MRPCWEGEATRPKGPEGKEALELHDEKLSGYRMRRWVSNIEFEGNECDWRFNGLTIEDVE